MNRRTFLKNTGFTIGALALLNQKSLASFLADPKYKITMLNKTMGIFTERGGTILFMLTNDGTVVVDSQFSDTAPHLIDEVKKLTNNPFRLLINTHHHGDHTGGNIAFKGIVAHVLAHENSKKNQQAVAIKNKSEEKQLYPDQIFGTTWCEKIGKEEVCLHYFGAGHTDGDSFVRFKRANVVHAGDLVFNRRHPFVDISAGANISSWIKVLETATQTFKSNTKYICGHSAEGYDVIVKKADVLLFKDYLQNVLSFVDKGIKAGFTLEEFLKAKEIPGSPEWKGDGIDRPIKAAYEELMAAKNNI